MKKRQTFFAICPDQQFLLHVPKHAGFVIVRFSLFINGMSCSDNLIVSRIMLSYHVFDVIYIA
jgi:hypothetical protein